MKLSLFANYIVSLENAREWTEKLLETIREFSKVAKYKITEVNIFYIYKPQLVSRYIWKAPFTIAMNKRKTPRNILIRTARTLW